MNEGEQWGAVHDGEAGSVSWRGTIALPEAFRSGDILAFHRRDAQQLAERVAADRFDKGLVWAGRAARLRLRFLDAACAEVELWGDGPLAAGVADGVMAMVRRMLGLEQAVERFEARYRTHPHLGPVIAANHGLRVPQTATPFEALVWAVTGQQISLHAAVALRRTLIRSAGLRHSSGLLCFPDAAAVLATDVEELRAGGFSRAKVATLRALAQAIEHDGLVLEDWLGDAAVNAAAIETLRQRLLAIRGIGPWTVNYALLRGFSWLDGSLHGDVAVRRGLQRLLERDERVSEDETRRWLEPFSPWRALVGAHLWTMAAAMPR